MGSQWREAEIIAFLDDDATAAPDWLQQLSTGYANPNVVGVGGAILPHWVSSRPTWFPEEFNWVVGCDYRGLPQITAPVRNLVGANMSMRREVFETVGKFRLGKVDTASRPEETELCIRTLQKFPTGIWLYEPRARVFHTVPVTRTSRRYFLTRCYHEGLGKAAMVNLVGAGDGLSAERSYMLKTLPSGVFQGYSRCARSSRPDRSGKIGSHCRRLDGYGRELCVWPPCASSG